jgi:hypothetical protein
MDPQTSSSTRSRITQIVADTLFSFECFCVFSFRFFLFTVSFQRKNLVLRRRNYRHFCRGTVPNLRNSNNRISVILGTVPDHEHILCAFWRAGGGVRTPLFLSPLRKAVALCRSLNAVAFPFRQTAESFRDSLQAAVKVRPGPQTPESQIPEWLPATLCGSVAKPANAPCYQMLGESGRAFKRPCGIRLQTCGT